MKTKQMLAVTIFASALFSISTFADTNEKDANSKDAKVTPTTAATEKATVKKEPGKVTVVKHKKKSKSKHSQSQSSDSKRIATLEQEVNALNQVVGKFQRLATSSKVFAHGPAVVSSPYLDLDRGSNYGGADLLINMPGVNMDMALIQQMQKIENFDKANDVKRPDRPVLTVSGDLEAQVFNHNRFGTSSESDINLTTAELMVVAEVNPWVNGLVVFKYDDSDSVDGPRSENSNISLSKGFITIGNLNQFPVYGSVGQMYVPFELDKEWWQITDTLAKILGKTKERPAVLGFNSHGAYGQVYGFEGDTYVHNNDTIDGWGASLGYGHNITDNVSYDIGAGYIGNIADSEGMQNTGAPSGHFQGFNGDAQQIQHRVPGLEGHATLNVSEFTFITEYVAAEKSFDAQDMTYNGDGAQPKAIDLFGVYSFKVWEKPAFIAAGYDQSWEALALNMPEHSYVGVVGISPFKDTLLRAEYRHDVDYDTSDSASGNDENPVFNGTGSSGDSYTMAFAIYF